MDSICHIPYSLVKILFILLIVKFVKIILQDSFFLLNLMIVFFLHTFSLLRKIWELLFHKIVDNYSPGRHFQRIPEDKLSIEEVKMAMEELIILQETSDSSEIASLFEEEVSLEEVTEAFSLFDENNDGFIDTGELRNVLGKLIFTQFSEAECKKMISAFDDDKDGRIDFDEFVKLLECSFS